MEKHTPVLLGEVKKEFAALLNAQEALVVLDCTLGQAGHSYELFKGMKRGVLISIDLDSKTVDWVIEFLKQEGLQHSMASVQLPGDSGLLEVNEMILKNEDLSLEPEKRWYIFQYDFADINLLLEAFKITHFDFILADLGFSNYQLTQNKGISFDRPSQKLDMRYNQSSSSANTDPLQNITAADVLNTFTKSDLEIILKDLGQIETPQILAGEIVETRKRYSFDRVNDVIRILDKPKYPKGYKYKFFQALRSFVNKENERLTQLLKNSQTLLPETGKACVITFNSIEEDIIEKIWDEFRVVEPNITEIIKNKQSRSAKLYIFEKTSYKIQEKKE